MFSRASILFTLTAVASGFASLPVQTTFLTSLSSLKAAETAAEVQVGDTISSVVLKEGQADYEKPVDVDLADLIKGKKVAIFAVPGTYTPGCSKSHLPSFINAQDELKVKGVDMTICIATNDAYVMEVRTWFVYEHLCPLRPV